MAEPKEAPKMQATLGLTGVTVNAMALIAPGAFLWITFVVQAGYANPSGMSMWAGIFAALMLAYATAVSYSELAKLYPGAGSSYLFAEQAFLNSTGMYRFARIAKFVIGWGAHLYYWVYPGAMVATIGIMIGYIVGNFAPDTINAGTPGPVFMALVAIIAAYGVSYIAFRGVNGSTMVNIAINAIQIVALLFFAALAITYRLGPSRTALPAWRWTAPPRCSTTSSPAIRPPIRARGRSSRRMASARDAPGDDRDLPAGRL